MGGLTGRILFPPPYLENRSDGFYIVGAYILVPFENEEEAKKVLLNLPTIKQLNIALKSKIPIATGFVYYFLQQYEEGKVKYFFDKIKKYIIAITKETLRKNYKYTEDDRYKEIKDFSFVPVNEPILNEYVDRTKIKASNSRYYYFDRENEICILIECEKNITSFFKRKINDYFMEPSFKELNQKYEGDFKDYKITHDAQKGTNSDKTRRKFYDNLNKKILSIEKNDIIKAFGNGYTYYFEQQPGYLVEYVLDNDKRISQIKGLIHQMHHEDTLSQNIIQEYEEAEKVYYNSKSYIEILQEGNCTYNLSSSRFVELEKEKRCGLIFRNHPAILSFRDVLESKKNVEGFINDFEAKIINKENVIIDHKSGLMWQQNGSAKKMNYQEALSWITNLNLDVFAGYDDWRLPTLEEALSLMESEEKNGLKINNLFSNKQDTIWTSDRTKVQIEDQKSNNPQYKYLAWYVSFNYGCFLIETETLHYIRAVRSV